MSATAIDDGLNTLTSEAVTFLPGNRYSILYNNFTGIGIFNLDEDIFLLNGGIKLYPLVGYFRL